MGLELVEDAYSHIGFGRYQRRCIGGIGILNSIEPMILTIFAIIGPILNCSWELTAWEVGSLTTVLMVGNAIGNMVWGKLSDIVDRSSIIRITYVITVYLLLLLSFTHNYIFLMIMSGVVGLFLGGITISGFTLAIEMCPTESRARGIMLMFVFWVFGGFIVGIVALALPIGTEWFYYVLASLVPYIIFAVIIRCIEQSPRQLFIKGIDEKANQILTKIASTNGKLDDLNLYLPIRTRFLPAAGALKNIFDVSMLQSLNMLLIWFLAGFAYYGAVILSAELPRQYHGCLQISITTPTFAYNVPQWECCTALGNHVFIAVIFSTVGDLFGLLLDIILLDYLGRKYTLFALSLLGAFSFTFLLVCSNAIIITILIFIGRAAALGIIQGLVVYTAELYPTTIRALAIGLFCGVGKFGGAASPAIVAWLLLNHLGVAAMTIFAVLFLLLGVLATCLPIETVNRPMRQSLLQYHDYKEVPQPSSGFYYTFKEE